MWVEPRGPSRRGFLRRPLSLSRPSPGRVQPQTRIWRLCQPSTPTPPPLLQGRPGVCARCGEQIRGGTRSALSSPVDRRCLAVCPLPLSPLKSSLALAFASLPAADASPLVVTGGASLVAGGSAAGGAAEAVVSVAILGSLNARACCSSQYTRSARVGRCVCLASLCVWGRVAWAWARNGARNARRKKKECAGDGVSLFFFLPHPPHPALLSPHLKP